jgi:hypothetical protein
MHQTHLVPMLTPSPTPQQRGQADTINGNRGIAWRPSFSVVTSYLHNSQLPLPLFRNEFLQWHLRTGVESIYVSIKPKRREQDQRYLVHFFYALTDERLRRRALRLPPISDRQAGLHYLRYLPRRLRHQINISGPGSDFQDIKIQSWRRSS